MIMIKTNFLASLSCWTDGIKFDSRMYFLQER